VYKDAIARDGGCESIMIDGKGVEVELDIAFEFKLELGFGPLQGIEA
jgi:hypothetical protein